MKTDKEICEFVEQNLGVKFPEIFKEIHYNGMEKLYNNFIFSYFDKNFGRKLEEGIGTFLTFLPSDPSNILRETLLHPQLYGKKLIPFVDIGGSNYLCFDYSIDGFSDLNPPIIFWVHEYEDGQKICDVAINFQSFLDKLESAEKI